MVAPVASWGTMGAPTRAGNDEAFMQLSSRGFGQFDRGDGSSNWFRSGGNGERMPLSMGELDDSTQQLFGQFYNDPRQMMYNGRMITRAGDADLSKGDFEYKQAPDVGTYWEASDPHNLRTAPFAGWDYGLPALMAVFGGVAGGAAAGAGATGGGGAAAGGGALGYGSAFSGAGPALVGGATGAGVGAGLGITAGVGGAAAGLGGASAAGGAGALTGAGSMDWTSGYDLAGGGDFNPASLYDTAWNSGFDLPGGGDPTGGGSWTSGFDLPGGGGDVSPGWTNGYDLPGGGDTPPSWMDQLKRMYQTIKPYKGALDIGKGLYGLYNSRQMNALAKPGLEAAKRSAALTANPDPSQLPGYQARMLAIKREMAARGYNMSGNEMGAIANGGGAMMNDELQRLAMMTHAAQGPAQAATQLQGNSLNSIMYGLMSFV